MGPPSGLFAELARWRDKATKRGKECTFTSEIIPDWLSEQVKAAIAVVGVEDAFRFLKQARSMDERLKLERKLKRKIQEALGKYQQGYARAVRQGKEPDYDALYNELRRTIQPEITAITTEQVMRSSLDVGVAFDPAVINTTAVEWARRYSGELVGGITDTTRGLVRQATQTFIETPGMTQSDVVELLAPAFSEARAQMISITEVTRAYSQATNETQRLLNTTGLEMRRIWHTRDDEVVCFPAGTKVRTEHGDKPIEQVQVGQRVLTRQGYKRVKATHQRDYAGEMVTIGHAQGRLTCTAEHPVWVLEKGWLKARNVQSRDRLQTVTNQESLVYGVFKFGIGDTYHRPATVSQKLCLAGVPFGVSVPICTVNLKDDAQRGQQEIDAIAAHPRLLDVLDVQRVKDAAHGLFERCLALKAAVASERAELAVSITGQGTEGLTTGATRDDSRRPSALLRTIVAGVSFLRNYKRLSASLAELMPNRLVSAFKATDGIAGSDTTGHSKCLTANRTYLTDRHMRYLTRLTTETAIGGNGTQRAIDFLATFRARNDAASSGGIVVALSRAMDLPGWVWRERLAALWAHLRVHIAHILTRMRELYHQVCGTSNLVVYNLQVEDDPVFFADGVLVHNCEICGPLNGHPEEDWAAEFPAGPPAHPRCRCDEGLSALPLEYHEAEAEALAAEREEMLREQGLWVEPILDEETVILPFLDWTSEAVDATRWQRAIESNLKAALPLKHWNGVTIALDEAMNTNVGGYVSKMDLISIAVEKNGKAREGKDIWWTVRHEVGHRVQDQILGREPVWLDMADQALTSDQLADAGLDRMSALVSWGGMGYTPEQMSDELFADAYAAYTAQPGGGALEWQQLKTMFPQIGGYVEAVFR